MNSHNETTSSSNTRRLIAVAVLGGAAAVAGVATAVATSGTPTTPFISPGGLQANGGNSPAAAATGFLEDFTVGTISTCAFVAPMYEEQCAKLVETVTFDGRGSSPMSYGLGNAATVGNEALVSVIVNYGCFSYKLVPPGSTPPQPSCFSNADKNGGLPKSTKAFAAAYAASTSWPFGKDKAIPCEEINGQWYVVVSPRGPGNIFASGASVTSSVPG